MITTPGPNNIMVTASGANFGYQKTLLHIFGIIFGSSLQQLFACLGLGAIFIQIPMLHQLLSWVGLTYMLYLAWKILSLNTSDDKIESKPITFMQAALFQIVNPKAWIIAITVASVFLPKVGDIIIPTIVIILITATFTFIGTSVWTLFGVAIHNGLKSSRNQKLFNCTMALLLVLTALLIVIK